MIAGIFAVCYGDTVTARNRKYKTDQLIHALPAVAVPVRANHRRSTPPVNCCITF